MTPEEASEQQITMWRRLSLEERFRLHGLFREVSVGKSAQSADK